MYRERERCVDPQEEGVGHLQQQVVLAGQVDMCVYMYIYIYIHT